MCEKLYDLDAKLEHRPAARDGPAAGLEGQAHVHDQAPHRASSSTTARAFNAAAVKTTLERASDAKGSTRASEISPIASVDAPDATTVVLHLKSPLSPLTAQLADRAGMILSPKAIALGDKFATEPGLRRPVHVQGPRRGRPHHGREVADYYGKAKVHLAPIVFRIITDPNARTQNLRAGDIQVDDRIQSTDVPTLQKDVRRHRDQEADDRLPGPDAEHREQERPAEAVLERRARRSRSRSTCAPRSTSRSTARRSTGSSSTGSTCRTATRSRRSARGTPTTRASRATCTRTSRWRRSSSRPPGIADPR